MSARLSLLIVLAGVASASSIAMGDRRFVIPLPPDITRPVDSDTSEAERVVANAWKEAAAVHQELAQAEAELRQITCKLQSGLERNSELVKATAAVDAAKSAYQTLRQQLLATLNQRADYRDAAAALARAQQVSAELRARAGANLEERTAAAQAVLNAKIALAKLENAALADDPDVVNAKAEYAAAAQHLGQLRWWLEQAMRQDPIYLAAKKAANDARVRATIADHELALADGELSAARQRVADQIASRQRLNVWARSHGFPELP